MSHTKRLISLYAEVKKLHEKLYGVATDFIEEQREEPNLPVCADTIYVMKKMVDYLEDTRKELNKSISMLSKIACFIKSQTLDSEPMRGELAIGTDRVKHVVSIPDFRSHPEECRTLMKSLGIPSEVFAEGAVRPHWPAMVDLISNKLTSGLPLPDGIDGKKTYPKYSVIARPKRGVDLDALAAELENNDA